MNNRISREELVQLYKIEVSFFDSLEETGLLKTETDNNIKYLLYDDLGNFERFANWHYDLEVNVPGLEIIHNLLLQIETMKENHRQVLEKLNKISEKFTDVED